MRARSKLVLYREVIPLGRGYNLIMRGVMVLLSVLNFIFILKGLRIAALSIMVPFIFIIFMYLTFRDLKLFVTPDEFIIKFWFFTSGIQIREIDTVEIKDSAILPPPYRGYLKFYWGIRFLKGLKIFKLRQGDAVHIRMKNGHTIIITAKNNQELARFLETQKVAGGGVG
ncbi:MAG TPA: hypothetical protein ENI52_04495 [Thermoplasmata archaeon]|nr:hypothetical protein [Thermoplasmata archaeon]